MEDPAEQPTIAEILRDYGIDGMLNMHEWADLLAALEQRDNILRTDAAQYEARKSIVQGLNKIIEEV